MTSPDPSPNAAHVHPWKISDVVLFPLLGAALVLEWFWPTSSGLPWTICGALGLGICAAGFWLINRSKHELDAADQPSLPGAPTTRLITTGPFAYSRNPNYLGAMIAGIGFALLFDALLVFAALCIGGFVLEVWMIRPEERYLAGRFGTEYEAYTKATRRWF